MPGKFVSVCQICWCVGCVWIFLVAWYLLCYMCILYVCGKVFSMSADIFRCLYVCGYVAAIFVGVYVYGHVWEYVWYVDFVKYDLDTCLYINQSVNTP